MGAKLQNWFNSTIWDTSRSSTGPTYDLKGTEALRNVLGYEDNFSNEVVTERRALGLATAWSCINVRSRTVASLPIGVFREEGDDKNYTTDHHTYYPLCQQASNYMSSAQLFLTSMIHSDSNGNSVIGINRDDQLRIKNFELICPGEWNVTKYEGDAYYKINGDIVPSRDVLHFRWFSLDGLEGISPIRQNQITFGAAFKQARYSQMALGEKPPGFLSFEGNLNPTQQAQNQKSWKEDRENGRTPILSGRWDYKNVLIPPGDAEYLGTAGLTEQQICGIYQMPPVFIQNYMRATWSNAEQADLTYAKHTITPIVRIIEQECNMKLFTEREKKKMFVKFNMNGLLRGDLTARAAYYTAMRNIGGLNGNEIRGFEDMNSYEGGDIFTVQGANVPIDQLREFYATKVDPTKTKQPVNGQKNGFAFEHN